MPHDQTYRPSVGEAATQWFGDTVSQGLPGAVVWGGGHLVRNVPGLKWIDPLGKFMTAFAPVSATQNTIYGQFGKSLDEVPATTGGHIKKWMGNAGSQAAIGAGMAGVGKLISLIPHPLAKGVGAGMTGLGMLATKWAPLDATFTTGIDLLSKKPQQQSTTNAAFGSWSPYATAGLAGLAGLTGANLLLSALPKSKKNSGFRDAASIAAMLGAGYLGWKYAQGNQTA